MSFSLYLAARAPLDPREPRDDIVKYTVDAVLDDDKDEHPCAIGHFDVWVFNVAAYEERNVGPLALLFDSDSQEAGHLFEALYNPMTEDWNKELGDAPPPGLNVLYLRQASFTPEFERSNVALAAAERTIETLGAGCGLAAVWPWDNAYLDVQQLTADELLGYWDGQRSNEEFWGRLSFSRLASAPILVRNLARRGPRLDDILDDDPGHTLR